MLGHNQNCAGLKSLFGSYFKSGTVFFRNNDVSQPGHRGISTSGVTLFSDITPSPAHPSATPPPSKNPSVMEPLRGNPTALDKIFLVWSKRFKSKSEIPARLPIDTIHQARSFARIRINVGFLIFAAVGSVFFIYLGKKDAKEQGGIDHHNLEWHRKINEQHKLDMEKKDKAL